MLLLARHAIFPPLVGEERLRYKPKERLRGRLHIWQYNVVSDVVSYKIILNFLHFASKVMAKVVLEIYWKNFSNFKVWKTIFHSQGLEVYTSFWSFNKTKGLILINVYST